MQTAEYDPLYLQGIAYFNECEFYEAHEVWEELWADYQGPSRKFFQGLIQSAVALHHFGNGNTGGARKLLGSCQSYLESYRPTHLGLDLEKFIAQMQDCFAELTQSQERFPEVELNEELIPEIYLDPPPKAVES